MLSLHRATQSTSDEEIIAHFSARARDTTTWFDNANHANGNRHGPGYAARFAADYAYFESIRGSTHSTIKLLHPLKLRLLRSNESDQGKLRQGRCCRKIAQRTHHRFPANLARARPRQEVYACDDAIGFKHQKFAAITSSHYSAIVTRTRNDG